MKKHDDFHISDPFSTRAPEWASGSGLVWPFLTIPVGKAAEKVSN
jgi:hypothetical protein